MSIFTNQVVVLDAGQLKKIGPSDDLVIGGGLTAGTLSGDGAGVTNIAEANVVGLTSALSTLTTDVGTANSNASAAVSTANAAAADAAAAVADAAQAQTDAAAAAASASSAATSASNSASSASAAAASASTAASDASAAASSASASAASAATAATDAGNAASSASAASTSASNAATSASNSVTSAAASAADAALAATDAATAQSAATASAASAATAATDASNAASSASSAASSASAAATDAGNAATSASNAATSASNSASSASAAAASASAAASDAASAISTANGAVSTANAAASDAAAAVSTANSAASDASAALAAANAALPLTGGTLTGALAGTDLSLSGDLTVQGNIVSKGQVDVIISDSFLDLNAGNVGSSATAGGFTVNVKKATGFTAETATAFVAGVVATSAPSMTIASSQLAAGDIVQVSNSAGGKNDGLYVVAGVAGSAVSIKGVGGTMPSAQVPFVQNQFVAGSGESAIVVKVDLAAIAVSQGSLQSASGAIAAGLLCYVYQAGATEANVSGNWSVLASTASSSLQTAYDNGNGAIDLASGKDFEINSAGDGSADVVLNPHIVIGSAIGFKKQVEANVAAGDILFLDTDGVCKKASSTAFSEALYVALESTGGSAAQKKVDFLGEIKVGITGTAPGITDTLYLSATAGKASKAAPATGSVISLGACVGGSVGGLYPVKFQVGMPIAL